MLVVSLRCCLPTHWLRDEENVHRKGGMGEGERNLVDFQTV